MHNVFIGKVLPQNFLLIYESPYKACLNYFGSGLFPMSYDGLDTYDFLNNELWLYLDRLEGIVFDYVNMNPFGKLGLTIDHLQYVHFAPLIKKRGSKGNH